MAVREKKNEPFVHITKRDTLQWWKAWLIRGAAIILALICCSVVIVAMTGYNPIKVYATMINGALGSSRKIWNTLQGTAILLCIALAVTPAFKMRFWNTGAEGQVLIGGLASATCMFYAGDRLPTPLLLLIMIVASIAAGAIWALIPAYFKAKWNTNETLFTLMMNYVATQLVSFLIMVWVPNGSSVMGIINSSSRAGWLPQIFGQKYLLNIIIVAVITVLMYIYLRYSKHGYEISVVGESENTAKYIGINVRHVILRTMALSGAICGVAGLLLVAGTDHTITTKTAGGNGFTAIIVSWLAKFNPIVMMLTSLLIVFLQRGSGQLATTLRLNDSIADIVTGIILFFIIGCEFFVNYKLNFRHSGRAGRKEDM